METLQLVYFLLIHCVSLILKQEIKQEIALVEEKDNHVALEIFALLLVVLVWITFALPLPPHLHPPPHHLLVVHLVQTAVVAVFVPILVLFVICLAHVYTVEVGENPAVVLVARGQLCVWPVSAWLYNTTNE
jgi:hypothetical protein